MLRFEILKPFVRVHGKKNAANKSGIFAFGYSPDYCFTNLTGILFPALVITSSAY